MRYIFLVSTAVQAAPTAELMEAIHAMAAEEIAAGRLIYDGGLAPPAASAQLRLKSGKLVMVDGPFSETKEVLGGFAIFELPDMAAAQDSARRFMDLHRQHMPGWEGVCDIRPLVGSTVEQILGAS